MFLFNMRKDGLGASETEKRHECCSDYYNRHACVAAVADARCVESDRWGVRWLAGGEDGHWKMSRRVR